MTRDHTRLHETLGRPELQRLVQRLRTRLERGKDLHGVLALPDATPAERDALNRLIGRAPTRGTSVAVSLDRLDEKLRLAGVCPNLREAVENLTGKGVSRQSIGCRDLRCRRRKERSDLLRTEWPPCRF